MVPPPFFFFFPCYNLMVRALIWKKHLASVNSSEGSSPPPFIVLHPCVEGNLILTGKR